MLYFLMRDTVAKQFTPVFEQNTCDAAVRSLRANRNIMEIADDFDIAVIGLSEDFEFKPVDIVWEHLPDFIKHYGDCDVDLSKSDPQGK